MHNILTSPKFLSQREERERKVLAWAVLGSALYFFKRRIKRNNQKWCSFSLDVAPFEEAAKRGAR